MAIAPSQMERKKTLEYCPTAAIFSSVNRPLLSVNAKITTKIMGTTIKIAIQIPYGMEAVLDLILFFRLLPLRCKDILIHLIAERRIISEHSGIFRFFHDMDIVGL